MSRRTISERLDAKRGDVAAFEREIREAAEGIKAPPAASVVAQPPEQAPTVENAVAGNVVAPRPPAAEPTRLPEPPPPPPSVSEAGLPPSHRPSVRGSFMRGVTAPMGAKAVPGELPTVFRPKK